MFRMKFIITATIFTLFTMASMAWGQSSKGIVVGNVTDPTGAVISGATVKITNNLTNVSRETVSTAEGNFRLDAVDPGTYKLEINAEGFKTSAVDNLLVAAGQITSNNLKLEVGAKGEVVEIVGNSVILQTQDGSRVNTLDSRQIVDLPIATLNPVDLVFSLPGVNQPGVKASGFVQGTEFSVNGLRPRANNQLLDGTDNNDNGITGQAYQPTLRDGYQEVSILGANNSAEYGRAGGAVANVVTKSGTNQFHGSVYDIINTSALSSLSSGQKNNLGLISVPVDVQNQPGFSLGGPIMKDKLFFFGTYQATRFRAGGVVADAVVPTTEGYALLRSLFPQGKSANLDHYLSLVGDLRGTANPIPIPLGGGRPDIIFGTATLSGQSQPSNSHQFLTRVDWTATPQDSFSFRYLFNDTKNINQNVSAFKGFGIDVVARNQNFYFNHTHTFSPSLTNEFRASYGRFRLSFDPQDPATLVGPVFQFGGDDTVISNVGLDSNFPQGNTSNNYQFQNTLTYVLGNHTIRTGADLERQLAKDIIPFNNRGRLTFSTGGGFPLFGNFVDGFSGTEGVFAEKVFGNPVIYPNFFQQAYFINDNWRIKPNLTVNLGLRYENYGTPFNVVAFPAFGGFNLPFDTVVKQKRDNNNFAPRLSFAYTPHWGKWLFGEEKTVIRGGYAASYDVFFNNIVDNTAANSPNVFGTSTLGKNGGDRGFANAGINSLPTTGAPDPLAQVRSISPNLVNPMIHVWNLGIQREFMGNIIVDVAYVGSRAQRLFMNEDVNPGINDNRIFPDRGQMFIRTNGGDSIYHSLQSRIERGFKNGLFARFTYTYSKAIDNVSEVFATTGGSSVSSNPFNRSVDRAVAAFDATHRASWTWVWDIPGPKSGILGQVAGGWTVSGSYELQTGAVETPFVGGIDLNGDLNSFNDRPAISNINAPANSVAILGSLIDDTISGYIDANLNPINPTNARYIVDPAIRTNIAGRNSLRANRINTMDFSVNKMFKLPFEGHKLEMRFELFNALNHPNFTWDNPSVAGDISNGDVTNPFFNNVKLNYGGNRTGRIQVRYSF